MQQRNHVKRIEIQFLIYLRMTKKKGELSSPFLTVVSF